MRRGAGQVYYMTIIGLIMLGWCFELLQVVWMLRTEVFAGWIDCEMWGEICNVMCWLMERYGCLGGL